MPSASTEDVGKLTSTPTKVANGHHLQEVSNPAFIPEELQGGGGGGPETPTSPLSTDMLPPLTLPEFPSLEELDPDWLTWEESPIDVKKFYQSYELPQVVKVDDGDYSNFGMGTHVDVQRPFLLYTSRRCSKVLVANIYWDDSKQQYVEVGPRVVIPVNYPGWFYFLQDSGKVGKTLKSIEEVVQLKPKAFLVRSNVPCFRRTVGKSKKSKKSANMRVYVRDQLNEGELLNYGSIQSECVEQTKQACCMCWMFGKKTTTYVTEEQYLRCTDLDGREVLLDLKLQGQFSAIGDPGTSSEDCVYQLGDVVRNTDLPTHMKLCWGQPPSSPCSFTGLLRLEDVYLEETVIACTLGAQRHFMVEFPTDSEIKFIIATDAYRYFDHPVIQKAMEQCGEQIDGYINSIKVVQSFYPEHVKLKESENKEEGKRSLPPLPGQAVESSHDESMDTTDDFTDDSDFSDFTQDDDNDSRPRSAMENHKAASKRTGHVTINDTPVIIYDDNYEEIPGERPKAKKDAPPPAPIMQQILPPPPAPVSIAHQIVPPPPPVSATMAAASAPASIRHQIVPPPPPMFTEEHEATDSLQPLSVQSPYSKVKLKRTASHPETVHTADDIIAPPQMWGDDVSTKTPEPPITTTANQHQPLRVSVSDTVKRFNSNGKAEFKKSNGTVQSNLNNDLGSGDSLGQQLRERLDAFLSDSVQELNRLQGNGEANHGRDTPMSSVSVDNHLKGTRAPRIPPKPKAGGQRSGPQALQSHEDINAFLETIFDPDSMTGEAGQFKLRSGTMPHPRGRPASADVGSNHRSVDDSFNRNNKPQYRVGHPEATLRRHNVKSLSLVVPTPAAHRPDHLPIHNSHHPRSATAPVVPQRTTPTLHSATTNGHYPPPGTNRENIFIPIRRPGSTSPPTPSGEFPPSPERDLGTTRADSGIVVSPRLMNDFHMELESPYRAPSEDPSWMPPDDLRPLSVTDIAHCLKYIGMKDKVVFRFVEEQIDGKLLQELDVALLKEGFPELNALERKKVLDFVGGWRPKKL